MAATKSTWRTQCPACNLPWVFTDTAYGSRAGCPNRSCTFVWWVDSGTSRPGDAETRAKRHETHKVFDAIWKGKLMGRNAAYRELAKHLGLSKKRCHIGMFDIEQCEQTQEFARTLLAQEHASDE